MICSTSENDCSEPRMFVTQNVAVSFSLHQHQMTTPLSLKEIKAVLILEDSGNRILTRYYDAKQDTLKEQKEFEKTLCKKIRQQKGGMTRIMIHSGTVVVVQIVANMVFCMVSSLQSNELITESVLMTIIDSLGKVLDSHEWDIIDARSMMLKLDILTLVVDEIIDNGMILEEDSDVVAERVLEGTKMPPMIEIPEKNTIKKVLIGAALTIMDL